MGGLTEIAIVRHDNKIAQVEADRYLFVSLISHLDEPARRTRPFFSGWVRYYGLFYPSKLRDALRTIDVFIVRWVSQKYLRFRRRTLAAWNWLHSLKQRNPTMFAHWTLGPAAR